MTERSRGQNIAIWGASGLLAALFVFAGLAGKLLNAEEAQRNFSEHFGLPAALALFIGACETAGAIGILIPRLASLAAAGLSIIMLGAAYSHLSAGDPAQNLAVPVVALALLVFVGLQRWPDLRGESNAPIDLPPA
jgi:uncharacterized membrane protein YphA (DoxX/SURF4 family)